MKKILLLLAIIPLIVCAQDVNTDYQEYRKKLLEGYSEFRRGILDDYANYLNTVWKEYNSFKGEKRDDKPKPSIAPIAVPKHIKDESEILPTPELVPTKPIKPNDKPTEIPKLQPIKPIINSFSYSFYGLQLKGERINTYSLSSLENKDIAKAWKYYQEQSLDNTMAALNNTVVALGLNEWFQVELVRSYVDGLLSHSKLENRIILQHFLLANLGYDVRIAKTDCQLLLLIPFGQQMYERSFLIIDSNKYYVFYDNLNPIKENVTSIYTCELPQDVDKGRSVNLLFVKNGMNITKGEMKRGVLDDGNIKVACNVNNLLMEMLRHYPQMDIPCYAESNVELSLHKDLLNQVHSQVAHLPEKDAVSAILHFVQYAFKYATDSEQHGYEKPYFIEENFYYERNDCEDRSILFAYLVHSILGLDVHLLQFPGHECTAVSFHNSIISGDGYEYEGKLYYICDPTYIGASIGQCMPNYRNTEFKIERWY